MTALIRVAPNLRAIPATHVSLQFVDRRRLGPTDDIRRHRLVGITAKAPDFEIVVARVECVAQRRRGLGWPLVTKHPLVPGAGQLVSLYACCDGAFRGMTDRTSINTFAGASAAIISLCLRISGTRYAKSVVNNSRKYVADVDTSEPTWSNECDNEFLRFTLIDRLCERLFNWTCKQILRW
jgi:hypothetical protein